MTDFETAAGLAVGVLFFVLVVRYAFFKPLTSHQK